jgi:hypothetical protein
MVMGLVKKGLINVCRLDWKGYQRFESPIDVNRALAILGDVNKWTAIDPGEGNSPEREYCEYCIFTSTSGEKALGLERR